MNCRLTEQLFEIIRLLEEEKKKPKDYDTGVLLYHAEVMFLEIVSRFPRENVSGIAERMGITKGAVTQISSKLVDKELLEITKRQDNKKEKFFRLTPLGEDTVRGHQRFHAQANQALCDYFSACTLEESATILQFLQQLKQCVPFCEFPCGCHDHHQKEAENYEPATSQCSCTTSRAGIW